MTANPFADLIAGVPRFEIVAHEWDTYDCQDGDYVRYSDVLAALEAAHVPDLVEVLADADQMIDFLSGQDNIDGMAFGDPNEKGHRFWWRKHLSRFEALIALATAQAAQIAGLTKKRDVYQDICNQREEIIQARTARAEAAETALAAMTKERDEHHQNWQRAFNANVRWLEKCEAQQEALAAERAKVAKLVEAGKALGLREIVAGWNGEGKEKPYTPHPAHLRATIKTTCGAVYALDAAITEASQ